MALKNLQSLVLSVATAKSATGLDGKFRVMRRLPAFLSYPRHDSPRFLMAKPDAWLGRAVNRGTAQAVARAGRPECWASVS
jgi:hypothetical protein